MGSLELSIPSSAPAIEPTYPSFVVHIVEDGSLAEKCLKARGSSEPWSFVWSKCISSLGPPYFLSGLEDRRMVR